VDAKDYHESTEEAWKVCKEEEKKAHANAWFKQSKEDENSSFLCFHGILFELKCYITI
jgi:hypothetical protein